MMNVMIDPYESYSPLSDGRVLVVRHNQERYVAALLSPDLNLLNRVEVYDARSIVSATTLALEKLGIMMDVTTLIFRRNIDQFDDDSDGEIDIDEKLLTSLRAVPTESIQKLVDDESIDENTRTAMAVVLSERDHESGTTK